MEERVHDLETHVADLRVANGRLSVSVDHLIDTVKSLEDSVSSLNETIAKGRGAIWVIGGLGVGVGSAVHWLIDFMGGKHP